jgi:hypothetical protein
MSTKLSIEDYNAFLTLTKLEYEAGLIKEESTSELLSFTIRYILNQVHKQPEYRTQTRTTTPEASSKQSATATS